MTIRKVFIVDDSATARMFTRRCLEVAGLEPEAFVEFESALAVVKHLDDPALDLLFIDLVMPKMSGKDLLLECRARGVKAPVVVVSSAVNSVEEDELKKLGARAIVKKPLSPESALAALAIARG